MPSVGRLATMPDYCIYLLNEDDDVVRGFHTRYADDPAACSEAAQLTEGHIQVEVWSGFRRVATFAPQKQPCGCNRLGQIIMTGSCVIWRRAVKLVADA